MTTPVSIVVLAKVVEDRVPDQETWRHDLGERPKMRVIKQPVALIWLNEAEPRDIEFARKYAGLHGYEVYVYPASEHDPLGRAKSDVLECPRWTRR
jgi:hypothetical protein